MTNILSEFKVRYWLLQSTNIMKVNNNLHICFMVTNQKMAFGNWFFANGLYKLPFFQVRINSSWPSFWAVLFFKRCFFPTNLFSEPPFLSSQPFIWVRFLFQYFNSGFYVGISFKSTSTWFFYIMDWVVFLVTLLFGVLPNTEAPWPSESTKKSNQMIAIWMHIEFFNEFWTWKTIKL